MTFSSPRALRYVLPALGFVVATLAVSKVAHAELGGDRAGVQADGARIGSRVVSLAQANFMRHDLTRANGALVHEFTNASDQVFAVTWSGPGKPDLRSLLGRYFTPFQVAAQTAGGASARPMHGLRRPLLLNQSDLQIQTSGHMGWFSGVAFIPSLAPSGFAITDLVQP